MDNNIQYEVAKGKLLLSAPFLSDIFKRSVVLLTEHNDEGSVGFIINKPLKIKLNDVIEDFPDFDAKVYLGGPVQPELINFIHKSENIINGGIEIRKGLYWGGEFENLKLLAEQKIIKPEDFIFYLGYSGWNPNQLMDELKTDSWFLNNAGIKDVFSDEPELLWRKTLRKMGGEYAVISSFPEDPSLN